MATSAPSNTPNGTSIGDLLNGNAGAALQNQGISWGALLAAIGIAFISSGTQIAAFVLLRWRLSRIYRPRTYLVPERERVAIPPHGVVAWLKPIFATPSLQFIQKCGLDAYFFLRYLRMCLKIFVPIALLCLPILLPINRFSNGKADLKPGVDVLSISNVGEEHTGHRLWSHLILAIGVIVWVCYVAYQELRGYIRVRQAYLTSPQHRIRASATTVLVTGIPKKWLTLEALEGLYDVFPGGIRNIWINRNFDELADKVSLRDDYAKSLEDAETNLIKQCRNAHEKKLKKDAKAAKKNGSKVDLNADQELTPVGSDRGSDTTKEKERASSQTAVRPEAPRIPTSVLPGKQAARQNDAPPLPPRDQQEFSTPAEESTHIVYDPRAEIGDKATGKRKPAAILPETATKDQPQAVKDVKNAITLPSPKPKLSDEQPLREKDRPADLQENPEQEVSNSKWVEKLMFWKSHSVTPQQNYPEALNDDFDDDADVEAVWRKYIEQKDRETMRLPIVDWSWFPSLPLMGQQVDRIYFLRREISRLNMEISEDQNNVEKFPFMNSAFIQFNHQVAAHMACQAVSHHVPQHMAPRIVEISPNDVLWDNMSIKWWERYIRFAVVLAISVGLIILYAVPVAFTGLLAKISYLAQLVPWLAWLNRFPESAKSIISGVLPPAILQILLVLVPIIYRLLVKLQGVPTGSARELGVQQWYFVFLFIQVFFVVSISGGLLNFLTTAASDITSVPAKLARTLPGAADYFFSYLMIQSLSNSASSLLQVAVLLMWFVIGPILDSTPRQKWRRQTTLNSIKWGSFFPPFTNFAVIGIIYSVIAPLILVFMLIIFSLYWIVFRYNVLYVYRFQIDTGGLLFPSAVNQLFTGVYVMEIVLIGYFFISRGPSGNVSCVPQAIIMIVALVLTIIYHYLLNDTFRPLLRYLPITLEDEAVIRDEEFARAQEAKWQSRDPEEEPPMAAGKSIQHQLEDEERAEEAANEALEEKERQDIERRRRSNTPRTHGHESWHNSKYDSMHSSQNPHESLHMPHEGSDSWHNSNPESAWVPDRWRKAGATALQPVKGVFDLTTRAEQRVERTVAAANAKVEKRLMAANGLQNPGIIADTEDDQEAQKTVADVLFAGIADELEDLTPDERDLLVRYSFQHSALRARRPIIWIPKDALGVSDDEIKRGTAMSQYLEMSNDGTGFDQKGRATFERSPPDFSQVDIIAL